MNHGDEDDEMKMSTELRKRDNGSLFHRRCIRLTYQAMSLQHHGRITEEEQFDVYYV